MKLVYILSLLTLFFSSLTYAQPYVKWEEQPPMEIGIKERSINNLKIIYNTPKNGTMYVTLMKDGEGIGNAVINVTRGKRPVKFNISIWEGQEITKKSEYEYRAIILEKKKDWKTKIVNATPISGVKAIKMKK